MQLNIHKSLVVMTILNIILVFIVVLIVVFGLANHQNGYYQDGMPQIELLLLLAVSLISLSSAVISLMLLKPATLSRDKLKQTESSIGDLNNLNNTLRAQRHDFMNHLQVVHSLIELGEHDEANKYISDVYDSIESVNIILKTGIPAVNAILEAKRRSSLSHGIEVVIDIHSSLSEIPVPEWEICRILGNLIDNAVCALIDIPQNPRIKIEIFDDIFSYKFRITDNGVGIKPEHKNHIFEAGFTTRKTSGEGMGLAICQNIISKYNGCLEAISENGETTFTVTIPRKGS